jgi:glycosyltransferase involved in cell wall biosynthesis
LDRPLHIVVITIADLPEGGGNTSRLKSVVQALTASGHHVSILNEHALGVSPQAMQRPKGEIAGADFEYVLGSVERQYGYGVTTAKLRAVRVIHRRLSQLASEHKLDVIWFNQLFFYDMYPLTRLAGKLGVATIQAYEDERQELVTRERRSLSKRLFALNSRAADRWCPPLADGIVVISRYLQEKYARLSRAPERIHLLPTVVDCAAWECGPEPATGDPVVLYTGNFGEQDEVENLITALAVLRNQGMRFRFVSVGGNTRTGEQGREARVDALIQKLGLEDRVERRGFMPLSGVRKEVARASVVVNLRRDGVWSHSGLSTKLSEYLASGRLVLASSVGDVDYYLKHGESALLLSPQCAVQEIVDALSFALGSIQSRQRIGAAGRAVAVREFDLPVAQQRLETILQDVLNAARSRKSPLRTDIEDDVAGL